MTRTRLAALAGIGLSLALTACAGLPVTSGVMQGQPMAAASERDPLTISPDGPLPGDNATQIVVGFLKAQMDSSNNYQIARQFLAGPASDRWQPNGDISIFESEADIDAKRLSDTRVRLTIKATARLAADGHLTTLTKPETQTHDFTVVSTSSGVRLAGVPPRLGLWLAQDDLGRLFSRINVYFPSKSGTTLVADPRWLPRQGLATATARAVLSEAPAWLEPAVGNSPFPAGTGLDVDAVPVDAEGVATVDLGAAALRASAGTRKALWAALGKSLLQTPGVNGVQITVGGNRLDAADVPGTFTAKDSAGYVLPQPATQLIIRSKTFLAWASVSPTALLPELASKDDAAGVDLPAIPASWRDLSAGRDGAIIAGVNTDRTQIGVFTAGKRHVVHTHDALVGPQAARDGSAWFADTGKAQLQKGAGTAAAADAPQGSDVETGASQLRVWEPTFASGPRTVSVPWLRGRTIRAFSVAPDGFRIALVVQSEDEQQLVVCSIGRDEKGHPQSLSEPMPVTTEVQDISALAWADLGALAVLGDLDGRKQAAYQPIDGSALGLSDVPGAERIESTYAGQDGLMLLTRSGSVMSRLGSGWNQFVTRGEVINPNP